MTVQSASRPTGAIKVPQGLSLELTIDGKPVAVPSGRDVTLPVGSYEPATLTCGATATAAKGKGGELWTIKSTGPFGNLKSITIQEGATNMIDAGPPLTLKVTASSPSKTAQGTVISIGLAVTGKAGEAYNMSTLRKGQSTPPPPSFQIVDEKGNVLASGVFEFG
jgi:hypothetical protein